MQQENKRENPQGALLKGIEPVSRPAELKVLQTGIKPSVTKSKNMLQFSNSLKTFADGFLTFDRAERLQGQEDAKKIFLEQSEIDKSKWADLTDKVPWYSRINPYTKEYYGDLLANQISDTVTSQVVYDYSTSQLISKPVEELRKLTDEGKKNLMEQTQAKGLSPSNQLNAIEKYERATSALMQDYYPKHSEYNYKKTVNLFTEKVAQTLKDLDFDPKDGIRPVALITNTLNKLSDEGIKNGLVDIDAANAIKSAAEDFTYFNIDDPLGHFDEVNFLKEYKEVKINGKTLDELIPHATSDIKTHIENAQNAVLRKEERARRMEDIKYDNAKTIGDSEIFKLMSSFQDPGAPENVKKAKALVKQLSARDPYFMANTGGFLKTVDTYTSTYENVSSRESRYLLADYFSIIATNPSALNPNKIQADYRRGDLDFSSYKMLLGVYTDVKNQGISAQGELLNFSHGRNVKLIEALDINDRLKAEMLDQANEYFVRSFTSLHDPSHLDPNGLKKYDNDIQYIMNIAPDKSAQYSDIDTQQKQIENLDNQIQSQKTKKSKGNKQYGYAVLNSGVKNPSKGFSSSAYRYLPPTYAPVSGSAFPFVAFKEKDSLYPLTINTDISNFVEQKMKITSQYGTRTYIPKGQSKPITKFHGGIDYAPMNLKVGDKCLVANIWGTGKVYAGKDTAKGGGYFVKIVPDSHPNAAIYMMHLDTFIQGLKMNQDVRIKNNVPLGIVGQTGNATGNCSHNQYSLNGKVVSPQAFEKATGLKVTY